MARVADAPDGIRTVIAEEQRAPGRGGYPDRPGPHLAVSPAPSRAKIPAWTVRRPPRYLDPIAGAQAEVGLTGAVGIELQNVGEISLAGVIIGIIHIGARADGNEHFPGVAREDNVARPMPAAAREALYHDLGGASRL